MVMYVVMLQLLKLRLTEWYSQVIVDDRSKGVWKKAEMAYFNSLIIHLDMLYVK
jgi:hypothetical protein